MWLHMSRRALVRGVAVTLALVAAWPLARVLVPSDARAQSPAGNHRGPASLDGVVWWVPTASRDVALTFDDGPDPTYTPQVLAALRAFSAVGTFFVLGLQAQAYPQIVQQTVAEGSQVCGHGFTHMMFRGRSAEAVAASVQRTAAELARIGAPMCPLFRFPYFASDALARATVRSLGLLPVGADVDTLDWQRPPVGRIVSRVLGVIEPGDIVLFHDGGGNRSGTVEALREILAGLRTRGLRPVTVSQLLAAAASGFPPQPAASAAPPA